MASDALAPNITRSSTDMILSMLSAPGELRYFDKTHINPILYNGDVVGTVQTGAAPTTLEWSIIVLPNMPKVLLILGVWQYLFLYDLKKNTKNISADDLVCPEPKASMIIPHCVAIYRQVSNIRRTLVGNKIVDHSNVVGASPVGAAPTTSSFST